MDIVFLVYDSRSGSTIFSRELQKKSQNWSVTQELGFSALLSKIDADLSAEDCKVIFSKLSSSSEFVNFNGDLQKVTDSFLHRNLKGSELLGLLIKDHYLRLGDWAPSGGVIVKNGSHIKHIQKLCGHRIHNYRFIYVFRDPRAVIRSKLTTSRPYYPEEKMAWGGVFLAALRWKLYSRAALRVRELKKPVCFVKYEQFVYSPDGVVQDVLKFLGGSKLEGQNYTRAYSIPEAERSIHTLVQESGVVRSRVNAWELELKPNDIAVIEMVCTKEMKALGYALTSDYSTLKKCFALSYAVFETAIKITRRLLVKSKSNKFI